MSPGQAVGHWPTLAISKAGRITQYKNHVESMSVEDQMGNDRLQCEDRGGTVTTLESPPLGSHPDAHPPPHLCPQAS